MLATPGYDDDHEDGDDDDNDNDKGDELVYKVSFSACNTWI